MVPCGHRTSETRCNLDGALGSNALAGATQPERAFVFLGRGREKNRGGRGTGTMICAPTLNAVGAACAVRQTPSLSRRQPLIPAEGSPPGRDRLQEAAA